MLSSGEQVIVQLINMVFAGEYYKESLSLPELVVLDEPDAHLHPQFANILIDTLLNVFVRKHSVKVIMTTHSPTTVALCPEDSIFEIVNKPVTSIKLIRKDIAISKLISGVPHLSISWENRRQVFVESYDDQYIYQRLYDAMSARSLLDPGVSLSFIPTGAKIDKGTLTNKIRQHTRNSLNYEEIDNLVIEINGIGDCERVRGTVKDLRQRGNTTVYGIVDWDLKNQDENGVFVMAKGAFYNIENVILNPVALGLYLTFHYPDKPEVKRLKSDAGISDNVAVQDFSDEQIHNLANAIAQCVIVNKPGTFQLVTFASGRKYNNSEECITMNGHDYENKLKEAFPCLKEHSKSGALKRDVVSRIINLKGCELFPRSVVECFIRIQNS
jgi:hypothetical protein